LRESPEVVHCIESHHGEVEQHSIHAVLAQIADGISGGRPGARRESLETYIKRLERLEEICNSYPGVQKTFAMQAGREVRVVVDGCWGRDLGGAVPVRGGRLLPHGRVTLATVIVELGVGQLALLLDVRSPLHDACELRAQALDLELQLGRASVSYDDLAPILR